MINKSPNDIFLHLIRLLAEVEENPEELRQFLIILKQYLSAPHAIIVDRDQDYHFQIYDKPWEDRRCSGYGGKYHLLRYLDDYLDQDLWNEFEKSRDITQATIHSQHKDGMPPQGHVFWEWMNPIDINDNAVIELFKYNNCLGSCGLNLHFSKKHADSELICLILNTLKEPLTRVLQAEQLEHTTNPYLTNHNLLDQMGIDPDPLILIAANNQIIDQNEKADQLFRDNVLCFKASGQLRLHNQKLNAKLLRCISQAHNFRLSGSVPCPEGVRYQALFIHVKPVRYASSLLVLASQSVLVRFAQQKKSTPNFKLIGQVYDLTSRETLMLELIYRGFSYKKMELLIGLKESQTKRIGILLIKEKLGLKNKENLRAFLENFPKI